MGLRLRANETLLEGLHRSLNAQLGNALVQMRRAAVSADREAIHEARKCVKKARALLRMLREEISEEHFDREDGELRGIGHLWGGVRDHEVILKALRGLRQNSGKEPAAERKLMATLQAENRKFLSRTGRLRNNEAIASAALIAERVAGWKLHGDHWSSVGPALEQAYGLGKKYFKKARDSRSSSDLHDWRKKSKMLFYATRILEPIWPEYLVGACKGLHELEEALGLDHDLAMLAAMLKNSKDYVGLHGAIQKRRQELQERSIHLGARIFHQEPAIWSRLLEGYWKLWRKQGNARRAA